MLTPDEATARVATGAALKLSEAIRLGAMLRPQVYGNFHTKAGTCAIGAAYEAIGQRVVGKSETVSDVWPLNMMVTSPVCHGIQTPLGIAITHLNDGERWTREQIADWVETVELVVVSALPAPVAIPVEG